MKYHYPILLLSFFLIFSCSEKKPLAIVRANGTAATILVDNKMYSQNWTITPALNPDILAVEVEAGSSKTVTFLTDKDSLNHTIRLGETKDFLVILNGKDTAVTRIEGVPFKVTFTEEYIKQNKGTWSVEVIEAQELFQIIAVITPTGLNDTRSLIINHDTTDYYNKVLRQFLPFKGEPIVGHIDSLLQKNWYINLKEDACALVFNEDNQLGKSPHYDRMNGAKNLFDPYLADLTEFARKANFRDFYRNHRSFYDSLIRWQERAVPTKKQWKWLERQFPDHRYDNYRILFSPLVKGNHSTVRFNHKDFKQAIMFIRPPYQVKGVNENVSEGLITRMVFTEIDHNYVNPESDKHIMRINELFDNRDFWTAGKESTGYNSPYAIFNEYMTWSVYLLYCYDQFNEDDFKVINERIVKYMMDRRGFQKFDKFHDVMLSLYKDKHQEVVLADLYLPLLDHIERNIVIIPE